MMSGDGKFFSTTKKGISRQFTPSCMGCILQFIEHHAVRMALLLLSPYQYPTVQFCYLLLLNPVSTVRGHHTLFARAGIP